MLEVERHFERRDVTVEQYATQWLEGLTQHLRPKTVRSYGQLYRLHIAPTLGVLKVNPAEAFEDQALVDGKEQFGS